MRIAILPAVLAALLGACAPQIVPNSPEACAVEKIASVPIIPPDPPRTTRWAVDVTLDGKPARMMLDSGATGVTVSTETADRLRLRQRPDYRATSTGMGGMVYRRVFEIDRIGIGAQMRDRPTLATEMTIDQQAGHGFDGIVGMTLFDRNDVEIDFPARTLTLYRARFCPQGRPPWEGGFQSFRRTETGRHTRSNRPTVQVRLDGKPAHALLDTGATTTVVDKAFATAAGAPAEPPADARRSAARTMSETTVPMWLHRFGMIEIGGARIREPHLWISDLGMTADIVVGLNFLGRLRIWISGGSDMVYLGVPPASPPARP